MPSFDIAKEEITAFEISDRYLFTMYFDEEQLFKQLKEYYHSDKYKLEIPEYDLEQVRQVLDKFFYDLVIGQLGRLLRCRRQRIRFKQHTKKLSYENTPWTPRNLHYER